MAKFSVFLYGKQAAGGRCARLNSTSHINSTPRESLNGHTPYDVALEAFGTDALKAFQLRRIDPDKVVLTPKLIRYNH